MTLKTNEIYHTMQKAQELAQRLKQEQRIQDLAQKGHDISKLKKNLGGKYQSFHIQFACSCGVCTRGASVLSLSVCFCNKAPLTQESNSISVYLKSLQNNVVVN